MATGAVEDSDVHRHGKGVPPIHGQREGDATGVGALRAVRADVGDEYVCGTDESEEVVLGGRRRWESGDTYAVIDLERVVFRRRNRDDGPEIDHPGPIYGDPVAAFEATEIHPP